MKKILIVLSLLFITVLSACEFFNKETIAPSTNTNSTQSTTTTANETETVGNTTTIKDKTTTKSVIETSSIKNEYLELFKDTKFIDGFTVYYPDEANPHKYSNKLATVNETTKSVWEFAQWSSNYDIMNGSKNGAFGEYVFENEEKTPSPKKMVINTKTGKMTISLNAESEYTKDRVANQGWPSLLIQQNFDDNLIRLIDMEEINMNMTFKITSCENKTISKYDESLHCAQFVWYLTLQNRNPNSKDFGSYVWFGLNLYDSRYQGTRTDMYAAVDAGKDANTGMFIYQPDSIKFSPTGKMAGTKEKMEINFNILDEAKAAFDLAKQRGYLGTTTFEDLYIGSTNFGFEVPGTFNITAEIYNIQVLYKTK